MLSFIYSEEKENWTGRPEQQPKSISQYLLCESEQVVLLCWTSNLLGWWYQHLHRRGFRIEWVKTWNYLKSSIWLCDFVIICYSCNMCSVRVDLIAILNDNSKLDYYKIKDNILSTWLMICGARKNENLTWNGGKKTAGSKHKHHSLAEWVCPYPSVPCFLISNKHRTNPLS